jgi:Flp pilus assembly pilin Flp
MAAMPGNDRTGGLADDESGQTMVEYALLLAVFGLPMFYVFARLLRVLAAYYGMISFMETLPLP